MNLVTYDPFRELRSLQDEVNRVFSSSFNRSGDNELMRGAWISTRTKTRSFLKPSCQE